MPTTAKKNSTPPAPLPVFSKTIGKFTFAMRPAQALPENLPTARSQATALPFKEMFDAYTPENDNFFVPEAFWTDKKEDGGRGADPAKVNQSYQKTKVRDAFTDWKKADPSREKFTLWMGYYDGVYDKDNFPEKGLLVYIKDETKKPA